MTTNGKTKPKKKPRLKHIVCKPCWELKYCPYGSLVEYFPLIYEENGIPLSQIKENYEHWLNTILEGKLRSESEVFHVIEKILCLEPRRWEWISKYRTEELRCSVFGHICPVFFQRNHSPRLMKIEVLREPFPGL
jgi:hypothetical protein